MVAGYTRQAAANIQPGLRCNAEDVNAEYNALATFADNTAGHDHSGSVAGDGAKIPLATAVTGVLPVANGGTGSSTSPPTLTAINVNPGGVLVGTVGTVPPTGNMTLNENTVVPSPPVGPASLYIVGANGVATFEVMDSFGGLGNVIEFRSAGGTAAAPGALASGNVIGVIRGVGYGTAYGTENSPAMNFTASETWGATNHGTQMALQTTPNGSATPVNSLLLQGNTATFSGNAVFGSTITLPTNTSLYLNGATGGAAGRIYGDGTNIQYVMPAGGGTHSFDNQAGTQVAYIDNNGNLVIQGPTGQKASGTTWSNPSSRDIKQDIQPYEQGLQAILALNPCTYRFNEASGYATEDVHIGLVHDETGHMPEMHRKGTLPALEPEGELREVDALDCSAVTWALVNAVKALSAEVEALKAKLGTA